MSVTFGECEGCGNQGYDPCWDDLCEDCKAEQREQDDERADQIWEDDQAMYGG